MKRYALLTLLLTGCLLMTACRKPNVPPADYSDSEVTELPSDTAEPSGTETNTETHTTASETRVTGTETTADPDDERDAADGTEEPTEEIPAWADAYAKLLKLKDIRSEHIDAYYTLIQLDAGEIPELVVLDDIYMELYRFTDERSELLMEDAYKSSAALEQNVFYQPEASLFASAFSTMGGGSGFYIYYYEQLDPIHVTRMCFNNNEDKGGEMPYNDIWDKAEEYAVNNNGWNDVTLGEPWVCIDEEYEDLCELEEVSADTLFAQWKDILGETEDDAEEEESP